jgi:hypothetical protein
VQGYGLVRFHVELAANFLRDLKGLLNYGSWKCKLMQTFLKSFLFRGGGNLNNRKLPPWASLTRHLFENRNPVAEHLAGGIITRKRKKKCGCRI